MVDKQAPVNLFQQGPYVQVAAFCNDIIEAKDGAWSLIRIYDQVIVSVIGLAGSALSADMPRIERDLILAVMLKSGEARGTHEIGLKLEAPSGIIHDVGARSIFLRGEETGVNLRIQAHVTFGLAGLYWFYIHFDDDLLTKVPLRLLYQKEQQSVQPTLLEGGTAHSS